MANVSRETQEKLEAFEALLRKWTSAINLVSKSTLDDLWARHIEDSLQLSELAPASGAWVDLGSGGGLPGIVISIAAPDIKMTLIESDQRKAAFLRQAIIELDLNASVIANRVDQAPPQHADILSARALAPLTDLLEMAGRHLSPQGVCIFPKGARHEAEIATAQEQWTFNCQRIKSNTNPNAAILRISEISRV